MPGFFVLSVNPKKYKGNFLEDLFWETSYQQHLGEEYAGLAVYDGEKIKLRTHRGLFRPTFSEDLASLEGTEGIGYCGETREPIREESKLGEAVACFSGNLINREELVEGLKSLGHSFVWGGIDIEVMLKLMAQGDGRVDGIKKMTYQVRGAYSLAILSPEGIYAVCSPDGRWPLVVGEKKGAVAVASDPCGFENFDFKRSRDLEPGEIALLKNGQLETKDRMISDKIQICTFIWVYTNYPNAVFKNIPGSLVRKRLGALLARRDIEKGFIPDVVIPIAHSGRFPAIGYHQEFCRQANEGKIKRIPEYDEPLLKYQYAGRSYPRLTQAEREIEAHIKQLRSGEDYAGKIAAVCDDSIRRGTQFLKHLIPKLKSVGIKENHLRIANPESHSHCPWGKSVKKGELLAAQIPSKEKRAEFLGADSLEHPTVQDLAEAIGLPLDILCVDCDLPSSG
jgi:amidophosphoribosyltransferase